MIVLGIETSCDETAIAVLNMTKNKLRLPANNVSSQIQLHKKWGGVVPELAARQHTEVIIPLISDTLAQIKLRPQLIDLIAVTQGPGLITALQVGVETAKTLAWAWRKPLVGVNHIAGHLISPWLGINCWSIANQNKTFPILSLVVSGGHTELYLIKKLGEQKLLGRTLDDAAGEAFDKVAKMLKLPYPGGPKVAKLAKTGNPNKFKFPRPMINYKNYNFSFAGLKTAVLYTLKKQRGARDEELVANICASFQQAAVDVLIFKTIQAAKNHEAKSVLLAGGVSANQLLRQSLAAAINQQLPSVKFYAAPFEFTGDNAAMIALAGAIEVKNKGIKKYQDAWKKINARANWELW
ncbi:MAG: tRNA (adenosine(37)-N6)-threonylcarbamoyltransferase complex transferase subunit TsaD [Patescibacteria group bacterium]